MKTRTNKHRKEVSSRDPIARYKRDGKKKGIIWSLILIFLLLLLLVVLYFFFPVSRSDTSATKTKSFNKERVFQLEDKLTTVPTKPQDYSFAASLSV